MSRKNLKERSKFLKELRAKSRADLFDELRELRREQFNLRIGAASGQPARPDQHAKTAGRIARLKTVLNETKRTQAGSK